MALIFIVCSRTRDQHTLKRALNVHAKETYTQTSPIRARKRAAQFFKNKFQKILFTPNRVLCTFAQKRPTLTQKSPRYVHANKTISPRTGDLRIRKRAK